MNPICLHRWTLLRCWWRSFFIQAGFNPQGLQNLGLLYALYPAFEVLYPNDEDRRRAVERHLEPFNTHPYVSAAIVGGILHYEQQVANGMAQPSAVLQFKQALMGPLAALGDGFFWLSLRPAVGMLGVVLMTRLSYGAPLVLLVAYNVVHLTVRARLFYLGWGSGIEVLQRFKFQTLTKWNGRLRALTAAMAGGFGFILARRFAGLQSGISAMELFAVSGLLTAAAYWWVRKGGNRYAVAYGSAFLAVVALYFL